MFDYIKNELFYNLGELINSNVISNDHRLVLCGVRHYIHLSESFLIGSGIKRENILVYEALSFDYNTSDVFLVAEEKNRRIEKEIKKKFGKTIRIYIVINLGLLRYKIGSTIRKQYPNFYNGLMSSFFFKMYKNRHKQIVSTVSRNVAFKDAYKGQRCFILGNGPSLNDVQLDTLQNEYVFGVNQIMSVNDWEKLNINFWVCIDGDLLGMWANAQYDFFKKIEMLRNKGIIGFVPIEAKRACERNGIDRIIDLYYLNPKLQYINLDKSMTLKKIDISRMMMQPYNAVIAAINIAIYMGFSEILLCGCDQSVLLEELKYYFSEDCGQLHAYDTTDYSEKAYKDRIKYKGMYFEIKTQLTQLMQYSILADYCERNSIRLMNLTRKSLISSIKKGSISDLNK